MLARQGLGGARTRRVEQVGGQLEVEAGKPGSDSALPEQGLQLLGVAAQPGRGEGDSRRGRSRGIASSRGMQVALEERRRADRKIGRPIAGQGKAEPGGLIHQAALLLVADHQHGDPVQLGQLRHQPLQIREAGHHLDCDSIRRLIGPRLPSDPRLSRSCVKPRRR